LASSVRAARHWLTERVGVHRAGSGLSSARDQDTVANRTAPAHPGDSSSCPCLQHLDALWFVAWMTLGDRDHADEAVIEATTAAHKDPTFEDAGPPQSWAILIRHLDELVRGPDDTSPAQRQAIALVVNGRSAGDAALILAVGRGEIHRYLREGLHALRQSARRPPTDGSTFSRIEPRGSVGP
jgi:hypothetical protein